MNKYKFFLFGILISAMLLCYFTYLVTEARKKGETHEELERIIANKIIDTIKVRLGNYYKLIGKYPVMNTKYFLDSIGNTKFIDKVYLYSDSIGHFIGVGSSDQYLEYKCLDGQNYTIELIYKWTGL